MLVKSLSQCQLRSTADVRVWRHLGANFQQIETALVQRRRFAGHGLRTAGVHHPHSVRRQCPQLAHQGAKAGQIVVGEVASAFRCAACTTDERCCSPAAGSWSSNSTGAACCACATPRSRPAGTGTHAPGPGCVAAIDRTHLQIHRLHAAEGALDLGQVFYSVTVCSASNNSGSTLERTM